jgi:flavin-dependent dehydrogenase
VACFGERLARTAHVGRITARAAPLAPLRAAEAGGAYLDRPVGAGWVAVGDAAIAFDPIAAQGMFHALYTGMKAGDAIARALTGDPGGLSDYARRLGEIRRAYEARHAHVHAGERRWPMSRFWARRHARAERSGLGS